MSRFHFICIYIILVFPVLTPQIFTASLPNLFKSKFLVIVKIIHLITYVNKSPFLCSEMRFLQLCPFLH